MVSSVDPKSQPAVIKNKIDSESSVICAAKSACENFRGARFDHSQPPATYVIMYYRLAVIYIILHNEVVNSIFPFHVSYVLYVSYSKLPVEQ